MGCYLGILEIMSHATKGITHTMTLIGHSREFELARTQLDV